MSDSNLTLSSWMLQTECRKNTIQKWLQHNTPSENCNQPWSFRCLDLYTRAYPGSSRLLDFGRQLRVLPLAFLQYRDALGLGESYTTSFPGYQPAFHGDRQL